ncbi:MAG: amidohydrolase family protein [Geothrix sp.]|uniref:adenosine deaminase family protein n=1 Tax=Geothrix sp. TaxID=1962974 RepID=UPI0017CC5335|nr:amidohydrolase family protein [Geothrix sp.]NWJ40435.1 amidohydrolase family protein [Geothrix sp.]WIL21558.1 MAG: amidohydrolase family protein [Geothrix sp.]
MHDPSVPPLIDRHTHLEGGLDPSWVSGEAQRRGLPLPASLEALWSGQALPFEGFIEAFLFGAALLDSRSALREAVLAVARRTRACGGSGFDLWASPHFLVVHRGQISLPEFWRGMEAGLSEAEALGVRGCVVVDAVNHFGPGHGHAVLDLVLPELPPFVRGFSTGGLEGCPFRDWAPVFDRARAAGLRIAAHAGENGHGVNVREAILDGGVSRIVHGIRADDATLDLLAERRIPVDICPSSNRALAADVDPHPLPRMLSLGVRCALGTDDPGVIPCDLDTEALAARRMGLDGAALAGLRRHGAEDAWCLLD